MNDGNTGYPWSTGDILTAADLNAAIANATSIGTAIVGRVIGSDAYGVKGDYVELTGTIGWTGNTVTITGANFTAADIGKTLIMPCGPGVSVYGPPALVKITGINSPTSCNVDQDNPTHPFSGVTTVVGGNGASPWAVKIVSAGTGGSLVGDVLTITGGTFARPATLQTIQTTVLSATVVNAGTGGPVGAVLLRGTTGYGRRVVLSGNINAGGSLDPTLSVTVLPAGTTTGADPGAYWYDVDDPNNEPVLANPRKVTWPGAFVTGSTTLTLNAAVLSPLVMPSVHVGASVFAVGDNGASAFPVGTVVVSTGTPNPTSVVVSQAATTNGTGQQISFTDNREDIIFLATFANNASTVTATTGVPAGVLVGQVIFGLGISGGDDPTAPLSNCTITSIDGTRTAIGISRPTTHAATTAVNLHAVPYLTGAVVKLNLGPAVLAFKDFGAYSTAPDFTVAQPVLCNGSASPITIQQAPPPQIMTQPIKVSMGTDITAEINAFWAAVRSALATNASGGAGLVAIIRPGAYLTTGSINARDLDENGLTICASGVMIHAAIANQDPSPVDKTIQRAWDASGSRYYTMDGDFVLYGDQLFPPDIGAVFAYSNANPITSSVSLNDINVWGYFKFAAVYQGNTEGYVVTNMNCSNHRTWVNKDTPCYGKVIDGDNSFNKLDAPGFQTHASFLGFLDDSPQSTCAGGAVPFSIIGCSNYVASGGYAASWGAPAVFCSKSGHVQLNIHCEVETLTDALFFWSRPGNNVATFSNSEFADAQCEATNSIISYDTLGKFGTAIRALTAANSTITIAPSGTPTFPMQVFDDHSLFTGSLVWHGDISVGGVLKTATPHWLANFPDDREGALLLGDDKTNFKGDLIQSGTLTSGGIVSAGSDITAGGWVYGASGLAIGPVGFPQGKLTFDGTQINSNVPIALPSGSTGAFLPLTGGTVTGATRFSGGLTASAIDSTPIGATTPSTGAFTNLSATGTVTLPAGTTGPFLLLTGGLHSIAESGAVGDGVTDDQPAIQAWLNTLTAGAEVLLQPGKWYYVHAASLTIPPHIVIRGAYNARDNQLATAGTFTAAGGFYIDPTLPIGIIMSASSALKYVKVYRAGMASGVNAATAAADYATWATEAVYRKTSAAIAISASPTVIPLTDTSGITVGMPVTGPGGYSPTGTAWAMFVTVTAISPGVSVTVSRGPTVAIASGAFLRFGNSLGVMVSRGCSGIVLDDVQIVGFRTGIQTHPGQFSITRGFGDCITNIECMDGGDYAVINDCEWLPLYGNPTPNVRPGDAVFVHDCGGPIFKGCFNFGWQTGWHVENSSPKFHACGAEVPTDANATTENWTIRGGSQTELYHCHAQAAAIGFHFDGASHFYATGCTSSGNLTTLANNVAHFLFENTGVGAMYGTVVSPFAFAGYPNKVPFKYGAGTINALAIHNPVIEDLAVTPTAPFIQGNAPFTTTPTLAQGIVYQGARPNGGTSTILPYWNGIIIDSGLNPIPTFTINMPAYPADCQVTEIWFNVGVTAITFGTTDGSAVGNWSTAAPAGSRQRWIYSAAQNKWFPGGAGAFMPLSGGTVTGATTFSAAGTALTVTNNTSLGGPVVLAASAGNFMTVTGGVASTNAINIQQSGTGGFTFGAGTAAISAGAATFAGTVASAGANILQAGNATGTNNVIRFTPTAAAGVPSIATIGVDTNIQLDIVCQGTGGIRLRSPVGFNNTTPLAKPTGWGSSTGGARAAITASSTLPQVAAGLAQLLNDLTAYGLIGV